MRMRDGDFEWCNANDTPCPDKAPYKTGCPAIIFTRDKGIFQLAKCWMIRGLCASYFLDLMLAKYDPLSCLVSWMIIGSSAALGKPHSVSFTASAQTKMENPQLLLISFPTKKSDNRGFLHVNVGCLPQTFLFVGQIWSM